MPVALIPLLIAIAAIVFVVSLGSLFFQISAPGKRRVPTLIILAGLSLAAVLFFVKLKAFAVVALVALTLVGFILAYQSPEERRRARLKVVDFDRQRQVDQDTDEPRV